MVLALAGCKQAPELPAVIAPYRIDIQQGNVVTQQMVAKLKAGMTRAQVRFALGSPLVVDPFRTDRWDYVWHVSETGQRGATPPRYDTFRGRPTVAHRRRCGADGQRAGAGKTRGGPRLAVPPAASPDAARPPSQIRQNPNLRRNKKDQGRKKGFWQNVGQNRILDTISKTGHNRR